VNDPSEAYTEKRVDHKENALSWSSLASLKI